MIPTRLINNLYLTAIWTGAGIMAAVCLALAYLYPDWTPWQ